MLQRSLAFLTILVSLFVTGVVNAQSYSADSSNWKQHVNGVVDEMDFCYNDGLNSKTSITLTNSVPGTPVDVRIQSWIDGGQEFDSGVFQMTGSSLTYTLDRSLLGTAATHLIQCKVTFAAGKSQIGVYTFNHSYVQLDPSVCH